MCASGLLRLLGEVLGRGGRGVAGDAAEEELEEAVAGEQQRPPAGSAARKNDGGAEEQAERQTLVVRLVGADRDGAAAARGRPGQAEADRQDADARAGGDRRSAQAECERSPRMESCRWSRVFLRAYLLRCAAEGHGLNVTPGWTGQCERRHTDPDGSATPRLPPGGAGAVRDPIQGRRGGTGGEVRLGRRRRARRQAGPDGRRRRRWRSPSGPSTSRAAGTSSRTPSTRSASTRRAGDASTRGRRRAGSPTACSSAARSAWSRSTWPTASCTGACARIRA